MGPIYERYPDSAFYPEDPQAIRSLVASMKEVGYMGSHPIVMYKGQILDGWHRYQAAQEAGVTPTYVEFEGDDHAAVMLILHENGDRRHLKPGQRAASEILALRRTGAARTDEDVASTSKASMGMIRRLRTVPESELEEVVSGKKAPSEAGRRPKRGARPKDVYKLGRLHVTMAGRISIALERPAKRVLKEALDIGLKQLEQESKRVMSEDIENV